MYVTTAADNSISPTSRTLRLEARRQQSMGRPASAGPAVRNMVGGSSGFQRRNEADTSSAKKVIKKSGGRQGPFVVKVLFLGNYGLPPSELIVTTSDTMKW